MRAARSILLAAGLLAALWASSPQPNLRALERDVFERVNEQRRRHNLHALEWDDGLAAEARRHSRNMAAFWFFAHEDPLHGNVGKRLKAASIPWHWCAENIFNSVGYPDPATQAIEGWLASPGHRANILNSRLTRTGVGASLRADGMVFVTQEFTRP